MQGSAETGHVGTEIDKLLQVCLISATLPHEILEMTNKFMTDPIRILVKRDELTLEVSNICMLYQLPLDVDLNASFNVIVNL